MPTRIKTGDDVIVIGGKDRGKRGKVLRVEPAKNRVYVEGLNIVKRHQKPQQVAGAQRSEQVGGVIEKEGPIHASNVMVARPQGRQAHPALDRGAGRQALPHRQAQRTRGSTEMAGSTTEAALPGGDSSRADGALRVRDTDGSPRGSRRSP